MATVMKASEFVKRLKDVAQNYRTLYVMGCFGAPMTAANKKRYTSNHSYNKQKTRTAMINAASSDTYGFDCVCLIKGILWGWEADKSEVYGGAIYGANNVPDISADSMINKCSDVSTNFSSIAVGEAVWCSGHIGVYIGDGLAVECTPRWANKVQITACNCSRSGYNRRNWTKHGKLPYIEYDVVTISKNKDKVAVTGSTNKASTSTNQKVDSAQKYSTVYNHNYKVIASSGLYLRTGASSAKKALRVMKNGTTVRCYGYYSVAADGTNWLYVQLIDKTVGFCSSKYLKQC